MDEPKSKEVIALVIWLQSFPGFGQKVCSDEKRADPEQLLNSLDNPQTAR
jgi:hypothetical protein